MIEETAGRGKGVCTDDISGLAGICSFYIAYPG
jgi:hypothetical protein